MAADSCFTGKEEDVEVGLQYFGKRFLNPLLGRWVSADPLAVHVPGEADLNLYAYVNAALLKNIDPMGLDPTPAGYRLRVLWEQVKAAPNEAAAAAEKGAREGYEWAGRKLNDALFSLSGTSREESKAAYERSKKLPGKVSRSDTVGRETLGATDQIVKATPAAAANTFLVFVGSMRFARVPGSPRAPPPPLAPVKGMLEGLLGKTYARLVAATGSEGGAMLAINRQATAIMRFVDGTGKTRTVAATANREVWKDLSAAKAAGELGDVELLPFVKRPTKESPHPDVVVSEYAKAQGATEASFASVPNTCDACQSTIPQNVPKTKIETPKK